MEVALTAWITWTPVAPDAQGSRQPLAPETQHCKNSLLASGSSVRTKHGGGTAAELPGLWWAPAAPDRRDASCRGHRRYGTIRIPFYPLAAGAQRGSLAGPSQNSRCSKDIPGWGPSHCSVHQALKGLSLGSSFLGQPPEPACGEREATVMAPPTQSTQQECPTLRGCLHSDGLAFLSGTCRAMVQTVWMAPVPFRLSPISCFTLRQPQMLPFCRS